MTVFAKALATVLGAGLASAPLPAQSTYSAFKAAEGIPQPHLLAARKLADQDNFWKSPALNGCYQDDAALAQDIIKDPLPTRIFDNVYFVGNGKVSAWLIETSEGFILIDTMNDERELDQYVIGGMKALGLDPARIRIAIVDHGHTDHYGGASYLQQRYGTRVYMSEQDWPFSLKSQAADKRGRGPAPKRDVAVKDGDTIALGDVSLKVYVTPGHTPGPLALIFPVTHKGEPHMAAFVGGFTSANIAPEMHAAYDRSFTRFAKAAADAHVDVYLANHGNYDDVAMKVAHLRADPAKPNGFVVGAPAVQRWLAIGRECNLNNRDVEAVFAARRK